MFDVIIGIAFLVVVAYFVLTRTTLVSDLIEGFNAWRQGDTRKYGTGGEKLTIGELTERQVMPSIMPSVVATIPKVEAKTVCYPDEIRRVENADLGDHTQISDMPLFEDPKAPEQFRKWFGGGSGQTI